MLARTYSGFAYLGLMVVPASMLMGFRHDPRASASAYLADLVMFAVYMVVHYAMMRPGFKEVVSGRPEGGMGERRLYIAVAVLTWLLVYGLHRPLPGPAIELPQWIRFLGICGFLLSFIAFLEGATFETLKGLLGIPGGEQSHTAGAETPLMTEGSYASVRHPMYRGFVFVSLSSLLIHSNAAQLAWAVMITAAFVLFIPIEERQLLEARGDEYRRYMEATPYRLLRGIW